MNTNYQVLKQTPSDAKKLVNESHFRVKAILFAKKINIRGIHGSTAPNTNIILSLPNDGICVAFHFGVLVLFNVDDDEIQGIYDYFAPHAQSVFATKFQEMLEISVQSNYFEGIINGVLHIKRASREHFEIIAHAIAKSIILDHFENTVAKSFAQVEPIAINLRDKGKLDDSSATLLRHIGGSLFTEHEMVGKIEVTEKPIILWEHGELEPLYAQLIDEFEILDRHKILDRKIELLARTAQTSLEVMQHRHANRLEWYIIILIIVSILVELYAVLFQH